MKTHAHAVALALQTRLALLERSAAGLCPPGADAARWQQESAAPVAAYVVMRRLSPRQFAQSVAAFVRALEPAWAAAWLRACTRTVFLLGDPRNLGQRFAFRHVSADGAIGWLCPASPEQSMGLQRLLVLFGDHPLEAPEDFEFGVAGAPPSGRVLELRIATAGTTVGRYHVDLNHVLAEGLLCGLIDPGDAVRVRHVPSVQPRQGLDLYLRALPDPAQADRRQIHAGLTLCA